MFLIIIIIILKIIEYFNENTIILINIIFIKLNKAQYLKYN